MQKDGFVNLDGLSISIIVFYIFSALWLVSYFRLICTDVKSNNYVTKEKLRNKNFSVCESCQVVRRRDIVHCNDCNVCTEFYDHHCGVMQVCVSAKTYKFFLLVIIHGFTQMATAAVSVLVLRNRWNNYYLELHFFGGLVLFPIIVIAIITLVALCVTVIFICQTPCFYDGIESKEIID